MVQNSRASFGGSSSPPPHMYETSTSESSRSHEKPNGQQHQQKLHHPRSARVKSVSSPYSGAGKTVSAHAGSSNMNSNPHAPRSVSGGFKSQAALLASSGQQMPRSPRTPLGSGSRNLRQAPNGSASASDVPVINGFSSPAPSYLQQHIQQSLPTQQSNSSTFQSNGFPSSSRLTEGPSISGSTTPAMTTQSEPGAISYSQYSYHTLSDNYSSSAPSSGKRRLSAHLNRFASSDSNSNDQKSLNRYELAARRRAVERTRSSDENSQSLSQSHQPLLQSQQPQQSIPASHHDNQSAGTSNISISVSSRLARINSTPANVSRLSVSDRIKHFSQQAGYPDPEPAFEEDESDTQDHKQPPIPLSPFYNDKSLAQRPLSRQGSRGKILSASREKSESARHLASGAEVTSPKTTVNHEWSDSVSAQYGQSSGHLLRRDRTGDGRGSVNTERSGSLPPVRRRKLLQKPAYEQQFDGQLSQQQQQERQCGSQNFDVSTDERVVPIRAQSPGRVQEMKRRLWSADEKLNTSHDDVGDNAMSEGRSNSPKPLRHSTGSMHLSNQVPESHSLAVLGSTNANVGGFKSKFYQAAVAAQRGERAISPARARGSLVGSTPQLQPSSTPPRPKNTTAIQSREHFNRGDASDFPTPPRDPGLHADGKLQPMSAMPPTPPHHSHTKSASLPVERMGDSFGAGEAAGILTEVSQSSNNMFAQRGQVQRLSQNQRETNSTNVSQALHTVAHGKSSQNVNSGAVPSPTKNESQMHVARLVAKLNAVSRDDPQAALNQIDSILRAECNLDDSELTGHHAMLMNAAAAAVGMMPASESPGPSAAVDNQRTQFSSYEQHLQNVLEQHNSLAQPGYKYHADDNADDGDASSDDETSVSSITNPTYRSDKPTHEQLHDVPPPVGISTTLYRRPRPNSLQGYNTPTNAVSGLELVQRHHQRQKAKRGNNNQVQKPYPYNLKGVRYHDVHPPSTINVTTNMIHGNSNHHNSVEAFTENLLNTSSPQQTKHHANSQLQEEIGRLSHVAKEAEKLRKLPSNTRSREETPMAGPQKDSKKGAFSNQTQEYPMDESPPKLVQPSREDPLKAPSQSNRKKERNQVSMRSESEKQAMPQSTAPLRRESVNPFDDGVDEYAGDQRSINKPRYTMSSSEKERKLDNFMSRRQEDSHPKSVDGADNTNLSGEVLARKIREWDELSNPASKVSTKSSISSNIAPRSEASAGASEPGGDAAAVNVSTASMSLGNSSATKTSRRAHPWDGEMQNSNLKIDFRETSMDNALGVEAECFSQSQASPARDLRSAARIHHKQQQVRSVHGNAVIGRGGGSRLEEASRDTSFGEKTSNKEEEGTSSAVSTPNRSKRLESANHSDHLDRAENERPLGDNGAGSDQPCDRGFEVTPVYASAHQHKSTMPTDDENWVTLPANSYFEPSKKESSSSQVAATLIDEDTQPVAMVRAPELPRGIADAFVDVPMPFDEESTELDQGIGSYVNEKTKQRPSGGRVGKTGIAPIKSAVDASETKEYPPPMHSESTNRGRRAFANFLKKRAKGAKKTNRPSPSPRNPSLAGSMEHQFSDNIEPLAPVTYRGRRTASKSPAPKNRSRTRSLDDSGRIRSPSITRKFGRFLR